MKIDRLETHDRLLYFQKQSNTIYEGCMDCIKNVPESIKSPFYVFAHPRIVDHEEKKSLILSGEMPSFIPSQRLIWMPRITKPIPQTNSYLFLAKKNSDVIKIIWMIPPQELWEQYSPGKMTHNEEIWTSIQNFKNCRHKLSLPDEEGPTKRDEEDFRRIMHCEARKKKMEKEAEKTKLVSLEEHLFFPESA